MYNVGRVVHTILKGAVDMREGSCTTAKAHGLAEVVTTASAEVTFAAHNSGLNCDALTDSEANNARTHSNDDACGFVAKNERLANSKVTVTAVLIIMYLCTRSGQSWMDGWCYIRSLPQRPVDTIST